MYKYGGHINFPIIFKDDETKEELSCIPYDINYGNFKKLFEQTIDETNTYTNVYKQLFPLYNFNFFIKERCKVDKNFILNDVDGNFILCEPRDLEDNKDVHVFQLTNKIQVKYNGIQKFNKLLHYYDMENFINEIYQHENYDCNLYDLYIAKKKLILNYIGKKENPTSAISEIFYKTTVDGLVFYDNFNIVLFMTFTNKINEFLKMFDYCYVNYDKNIEYEIKGIEYSDALVKQIFKTDNSRKIVENLTNNELLSELIYNTTETFSIDKLIDALYIISKNIRYNQKYDEKIYNVIIEKYPNCNFLKLIKINKAIREINFFIDENDYEYVINAYVYADIANLFHKKENINKKTLEKKINSNRIYNELNFYLFIISFFDKMEKLCIDCENTNFNNTYYDFIKLMIGTCYYNYLETNSEVLPFSLKTHAKKYIQISIHNPNIITNYTADSFEPIELSQHTIHSNGHRFNSCGESTFLNLIEFILTDLTNTIPEKNIILLNEKFPNNELKEIFNWEKLKNKQPNELKKYFDANVENFGNIIANIKTKHDIYNKGVCELNPSFKNVIFVLQKILNNASDDSNYDKTLDFFKYFNDLFEKKYIINGEQITYENSIIFKFTFGHGYVTLLNKSGLVQNIFNKLLLLSKYKNFNEIKKYDFLYGYGINYCKGKIIKLYDCYNRGDEHKLLNLNAEKCTHLYLSDSYNRSFASDILINCTHLKLGKDYNQPFAKNTFVNCIDLTLGVHYDQPFAENSFVNCTHLTLGQMYDQPFTKNSFVNCTHLTLGHRYSKQFVPNTFNSCTHLTLGDNYNKQFVPNTFNSCTHLILSYDYNQPFVKNSFVNCIYLKLGSKYNQPFVPNSFNNCTHLILGEYYNEVFVPNTFNSCTHLTMGSRYNLRFVPNTFNSCTHLTMGYYYNQQFVPNTFVNCTYLKMGYNFNQPFVPNTFNSCTHLTLDDSYNQPFVPNTFNSCTHLVLNYRYNQPFVPNTFVNCTHLTLGSNYNLPFLENVFTNCISITFSPETIYTQKINNTFISNCTHIYNLSFMSIPMSKSNTKFIIEKDIFNKCKFVSFNKKLQKNISNYTIEIEENAFPECEEADFLNCYDYELCEIKQNMFPKCTIFTFSKNYHHEINDTLNMCKTLKLESNFKYKYLSLNFAKKLYNFYLMYHPNPHKRVDFSEVKLIENGQPNYENLNSIIIKKENEDHIIAEKLKEQLQSQPINPEISTFYKNKYSKYSKKLKLISFI